jgi:hypothetical protein
MSTRAEDEILSDAPAAPAVELTIEPRVRSLGEFDVRRVLPAAKRRMVGPFVFLDHMGPAVFPPSHGIAVRPHPHIGLATITYLFEGEIMHRDSLGYRQLIEPGAVNLMTAGRGIVHSERAGDDLAVTSRLHGIQSWIAYGLPSPVLTYSPTLYFEATLPQGGALAVLDEAPERAVYVVSGRVAIGDDTYGEGTLAVLRAGSTVPLRAETETRALVVGGAPVGPRHIWWNFVSSSEARIERAKQDWAEMRMGNVPGDDEYIPLPSS